MKHDKIGHKQIGLSQSNETSPKLPLRIKLTGALVMTITGIVLAATALWLNPQVLSHSTADPLLSTLMPPNEQEPRHFAELLRAEVRNTAWANQTEAALRDRYAPFVSDGSITIMRLTCAATVCEIIGRTGEGEPQRVNAIWQALQDTKLTEVGRQYRLRQAAMTFGTNALFAAYWTRAK